MYETVVEYALVGFLAAFAIWALIQIIFSKPGQFGPSTSSVGVSSVYRGASTIGFPVLSRYGDEIYEGASQAGFPRFTIRGRSVYRGASGSGFPVCTVDSSGYVTDGARGGYVGMIAAGSVWRLNGSDKSIVASGSDEMLLAAALFVL